MTPEQNEGFCLNIESPSRHNYDPEVAFEQLLRLPLTYVRLPVRFNQVHPDTNVWDFTTVHGQIEKLSKHGKKVILQAGIKTHGYPEVYPNQGLIREFPYLGERGVVLDREPGVRAEFIEYHQRVMEELAGYDKIVAWHPENEGFSKRVAVANYRCLSVGYINEVLSLIAGADYQKRPIIQNLPWDTAEAWPSLLTHPLIKTLSLNCYPNARGQILLGAQIRIAAFLTKKFGKNLGVSEFQANNWLDFPFDENKFYQGKERLQRYKPEFFLYWDLEERLRKASLGDFQSQSILSSIGS